MAPLSAIIALELDIGSAPVTRALATLNGLEIAEPATGRAGSIFTLFAGVAESASAVMVQLAGAMADGQITPAEARRVDEAAAQAAAMLERLRSNLAGLPNFIAPQG